MSPSDFHDGPRPIPSDRHGWRARPRHRRGSRTLPPRPCAHADSNTPAGEDGISGRLLHRPTTAFPLFQEGRLQQDTIEACSEFTRFGLRTCTLVAPGTSPEASAGQLLTSTAPVATGRTDNSPDGTCTRWSSRPRRSLLQLPQLNQTPFRAALKTDVTRQAVGQPPPGLPMRPRAASPRRPWVPSIPDILSPLKRRETRR
jgi:hypothetical protein